MSKLRIEFDNSTRSYFSGQNVSGNILFNCDNEKKVQGLKVKFSGKASVHWTEEEKERDRDEERTVTRTYSDSDNLFEYNYYALGDDRNEIKITAGQYSYPFQFTLPSDLPSSFSGQYGQVKYEVEARMKRNFKVDYKDKCQFTVNAIRDLNKEIDFGIGQPGEVRKNKSICCLWCKSGPIGFYLRIPRRGFVPGEFIPVTMELTNMSSRSVSEVEMSLVQVCSFYAQTSIKKTSKNLLQIQRPGPERGNDSDIWQGKFIQIPPVCPSKLGNCRIIDVQYNLYVEMKINGALNLKGELPIVIGTIPLRNQFSELMPSSDSPSQSAFNRQLIPDTVPYDLPPPSYEQCMFSEKSVQKPDPNFASAPPEDFEEHDFIPKYVTYGWSTSTNRN